LAATAALTTSAKAEDAEEVDAQMERLEATAARRSAILESSCAIVFRFSGECVSSSICCFSSRIFWSI